MSWLQHFNNGDDAILDFLVALVLLLTLISLQKPVGIRAKKVLMPLEVIAVIFALKNQQVSLRKVPFDTCSAAQQQGSIGFLSGAGLIRMTMRPPILSSGDDELPPLT
jgi:hypothetical protein